MFEGQLYAVDQVRAYALDRIVLPDGTVIQVIGWEETMPPKPMELVPTSVLIGDQMTAEQIAELMNGALAREVTDERENPQDR